MEEIPLGPEDRTILKIEGPTVARRFEQRLDRCRPLWQMELVPTDEGAAVVWRIHHALADGTTAMRFAREVLWDPQAGATAATTAQRAAHAAADDERRRQHLRG